MEVSESIPDPSWSELVGIVKNLDIARDSFFYRIATHRGRPSKQNCEQLEEASVQMGTSMHSFIDHIVKEDLEIDAKAKILTGFVRNEDDQRVAFINDLVGKPLLRPTTMSQEEMDSVHIHLLQDNPDMATELLFSMITDDFTIDLEKILEDNASTKSARFMELGRMASIHGRDVAKIALGVAAGIWLSRRLGD